MKRILFVVLICLVRVSYGQLSTPNGTVASTTNPSTGNVGIGITNPSDKLVVNGTVTSTANYGFTVAPASGDAVIRRGNPGSLMLSSNGGASDIRFNYNYGGGSGGVYVYDGGVTNYAGFVVNSSGNLGIFSYGGKVGIGIGSPDYKLHVQGAITAEGDGGANYADLNLKNGATRWHISGPRYGENNRLGFFWHDGTAYHDFFTIMTNGNVGIGTHIPDAKLAVKGMIHTQEVKVDLQGSIAPDYVFEETYQLPSLTEVARYIKQHKHLPEIPSAKEMEENGVQLGEMNMMLLKKIEELTLYVIELKEENERLKIYENELKELKASVQRLNEAINQKIR